MNKRILILTVLMVVSIWLTSCADNQPVVETLPPPTVSTMPTSTIAPTMTPTIAPTSSPEPTATTLPPTVTSTSTPLVFHYTVKAGDTLWDIAQKYDVPVAFIALQSGIVDVNNIMPGDKLLIPESGNTPPILDETGKKIVVILSIQRLYVYEDGVSENNFSVSTGLPDHPTVEGLFSVYVKYESTRMSGPGYDIPDVPWTMYFYRGYGIHGAYWHDNFGNPMSHGCINMRVAEAEWLYNWAEIGTPVLIYP